MDTTLPAYTIEGAASALRLTRAQVKHRLKHGGPLIEIRTRDLRLRLITAESVHALRDDQTPRLLEDPSRRPS